MKNKIRNKLGRFVKKDYPELIFNVNNGINYCAEFHLKTNLHKRVKQLNKIGGNENFK